MLSKGLLKLSPGTYAVIARKIRRQAEIEYFYAREKKLAVVAQRLRPLLWVGDVLMPQETHRLRVALERCQHLASLQRADEIVRERRSLNHLGGEINHAAQTARSRPVSAEAVEQLRAGIHVLELHRPDDFRHLAAWRGREEVLLAQVVEKLDGPGPGFGPELHNAAHLAGRIGYLLAKERQTSRGAVPPNLRSYEKEILLANGRFAAADAPLPFPTAVLTAAPPTPIAVAIVTLRHAGFLSEGPEWSLRASSAPQISALVRKPLDRIAEQDRDR